MIKIISKVTSSKVNDPYLRLCAGILKKAVVDARGGDKEALLFLETEFARWMADATGFERALSRFCDGERSKYRPTVNQKQRLIKPYNSRII
jgi:hypothetical protein